MEDKCLEPALTWPDDELARRLIQKGLVAADAMETAAAVGRKTGHSLADALVSTKAMAHKAVGEELAAIHGVPYIDLRSYVSDPAALALVNERAARELHVFPLFAVGEAITVALSEPGDITVTDRITALTKRQVEVCLALRDEIEEAINRAYGSGGQVRQFLEGIDARSVPATTRPESQKSTVQSPESPVSQLVDLIIAQAVRDRASDIHVDPEEHTVKIRFRVDGVLHEIPPPPRHLLPFVLSRIKVMSSMDIADSRVPQDGHFKTNVEGRELEARVSTVPTIHGENLAIRLLDSRQMNLPIEELGFPENQLARISEMLQRPHGLIVVTGPTGSGKSTTLYAMLARARSPERHIVTIEDPVERRMEMVSQIQINEKAGVTFASALRSILRQDPDVIMVGEMRDAETAQLAVRAALTGHLVFSTVHTNDAAGMVTRLVNMGVEPFLISSSLVGVLAQRLARRICPECRSPAEIPPALSARLASTGVCVPATAWKGKGCSHCRGTGYLGRIAVFELMANTVALGERIAAAASTADLRAQARRDGMIPMLDDGIDKVVRGVTTVEEVLRISEVESSAMVSSKVPAPAPAVPAAPAAPVAGSAMVSAEAAPDVGALRRRISGWLSRKD